MKMKKSMLAVVALASVGYIESSDRAGQIELAKRGISFVTGAALGDQAVSLLLKDRESTYPKLDTVLRFGGDVSGGFATNQACQGEYKPAVLWTGVTAVAGLLRRYLSVPVKNTDNKKVMPS